MRDDRDVRGPGRGRERGYGRGDVGADYEAPWVARPVGYGRSYTGPVSRSRGAQGAGRRRSELERRNVFEWGGGYVGGRGYGGTNYDLEHGYLVGGWGTERRGPSRGEARLSGAAMRRGYEWGEEAAASRFAGPYGPARYGYGPYHERLRRRRRSDEEIRRDVEDALFYDTWVDADRIQVEVSDGVVVLRGTLPDHREVRYAIDDAWDVDGVQGVRSELRVSARAPGAGERGDQRADTRVARRVDERGAAVEPARERKKERGKATGTAGGEEKGARKAAGSGGKHRRTAQPRAGRKAAHARAGGEEAAGASGAAGGGATS